jgi:hypothetical protein
MTTFTVPNPVVGKVAMPDFAEKIGRHDERLKTVEERQSKMEKRLSKIELALAAIQGKWALLAIVGMAAVGALFKYLLP